MFYTLNGQAVLQGREIRILSKIEQMRKLGVYLALAARENDMLHNPNEVFIRRY